MTLHLEAHLAHYMANLKPECKPDFFVDTRDCDDELPTSSEYYLDELFDMNSCLSLRSLLLYDMMPGGQYGATDGEDLTSVFTIDNALSHGDDPSADGSPENWQHPMDPYINNDGSTAIITGIEYDPVEEVYIPALTEAGVLYLSCQWECITPTFSQCR